MLPHFDLGLLEMMFTDRPRRRFARAHLATQADDRLLHRGGRRSRTRRSVSSMDFLRVHDMDKADPRYGSLTPGAVGCIALFVFGLVMVRRITAARRKSVKIRWSSVSLPRAMLCAASPDIPIEATGSGVTRPSRARRRSARLVMLSRDATFLTLGLSSSVLVLACACRQDFRGFAGPPELAGHGA